MQMHQGSLFISLRMSGPLRGKNPVALCLSFPFFLSEIVRSGVESWQNFVSDRNNCTAHVHNSRVSSHENCIMISRPVSASKFFFFFFIYTFFSQSLGIFCSECTLVWVASALILITSCGCGCHDMLSAICRAGSQSFYFSFAQWSWQKKRLHFHARALLDNARSFLVPK